MDGLPKSRLQNKKRPPYVRCKPLGVPQKYLTNHCETEAITQPAGVDGLGQGRSRAQNTANFGMERSFQLRLSYVCMSTYSFNLLLFGFSSECFNLFEMKQLTHQWQRTWDGCNLLVRTLLTSMDACKRKWPTLKISVFLFVVIKRTLYLQKVKAPKLL